LQLLRACVVTADAATPETGVRVARAAAAITATGAVACGVCCVLPFALPAAVLAVSGGFLAWFGQLMPWMTAVAFIAVAAGWLWVTVQTVRSRRRLAASTLLTMSAATLLLVAALSWPHLERLIFALLHR
jgi:hypothetical protein